MSEALVVLSSCPRLCVWDVDVRGCVTGSPPLALVRALCGDTSSSTLSSGSATGAPRPRCVGDVYWTMVWDAMSWADDQQHGFNAPYVSSVFASRAHSDSVLCCVVLCCVVLCFVWLCVWLCGSV